MKKTKWILVAFVLALTFLGCSDGSVSKDVLDGTTWGISAQEVFFETEYTIVATVKFTSPDIEWTYSYTPAPSAEVAAYFPTLVKGTYTVSGNNVLISPEGYDEELNATISGNKLTFPGEEGEPDIVYTKK
jgi:hypothetical protein